MDTMSFDFSVYNAGCPTRKILDLIGDKWTVLIIGSLANRKLRFSQLLQNIGGISQKMLTQTLRSLERDGIVQRTVYAEVPLRVEYELTELGKTLEAPIQVLREWAETHINEVMKSQYLYDQASHEEVG